MTGAAALCARVGLPGRGRDGPAGGARGRARPSLPATEAVGVALPAEGWVVRGPGGGLPLPAVVVGPGLGREPATPRPRSGRLVAESPVPVVVDADGLYALGSRPASRRSSAARSAGGADPPRRRVRPADGRRDPGPDRIAAARSLAARSGAVVLVKGPTTAVAAPDGRVLLATAGTTAPGHRRHRRRAVGDHRGLAGPGRGPRWRPPPWPPTSTAGPAPVARPRAWWPGTCPTWWPRVLVRPRTLADGRAGPVADRWRPAWADDRPRRRPPQRRPARPTVGAGGPVRGGQGRRLRPRRACRWPGPPWRAAPPGWPWPWSKRGWTLRRGRHRRPDPPAVRAPGRGAWPRRWPDGLRPDRLHLERAGAAGRGGGRGGRVARSTVHLKVDTGMHRVGADPAEVAGLADAIAADPRLRLGAVWTHLAVAEGDGPDDREFTGRQLRAVRRRPGGAGRRRAPAADDPRGQLGRRHRRGPGPPRPGSLRDRPLRGGPHPGPGRRAVADGDRRGPAAARPLPAHAGSPSCAISTPASVPPTAVRRPPRRAVDGGHRPHRLRRRRAPPSLRRGGEVLIRGVRRPLAGTVTMDQIVVDCGPVGSAPVEVGDEVVLLGRQGDRGDHRRPSGPACSGTISYEVLCGIGPTGAPPGARETGSGRRPRPPDRGRAHGSGSTMRRWHRGPIWPSSPGRPPGCTRCPLAADRTQVVFGVGDPDADLMFVGEAPGRDEDLQGEPFVGRSGKLLDRLVAEELGIDRSPVLHRQRGQVPAPGQPGPRSRTRSPRAAPTSRPSSSSSPRRWWSPSGTSPPSSCSTPTSASPRCGARPTRGGRATSCPPTTRRRPCARAAWWWPRCGPTSIRAKQLLGWSS